jgi:hypothetical protein
MEKVFFFLVCTQVLNMRKVLMFSGLLADPENMGKVFFVLGKVLFFSGLLTDPEYWKGFLFFWSAHRS